MSLIAIISLKKSEASYLSYSCGLNEMHGPLGRSRAWWSTLEEGADRTQEEAQCCVLQRKVSEAQAEIQKETGKKELLRVDLPKD